MKRRNNIIAIIVLAIVAVFATIALGCANKSKPKPPPQDTAFAAPTAFVSNDTRTWAEEAGATSGYTVKINSDESTVVMTPSLDLMTVTDKLVAGDNTLSVKVNGVSGGKKESAYSKAVKYNFVPPVIMIMGATDTEIMQGTFFDYLAGVTAVTDRGDDLTAKITVSGNFNSSAVGLYTLTYSVSDGMGNTAKRQREITVKANQEIGKVDPTPTFTYTPSPNDPDASPYYNIAKGCKTTANSIQGNANAAYATDGDMSTRWESAHGVDNVNFTVDLGAELTVNAINIYWEAAYARTFALLTSLDGASWETVERIEDQTLHTGNLLNAFDFTSAQKQLTARYVRIACTKRDGNYGYSIFEFEVLGPTGTVIPTDSYPVLFDARNIGSPDWATEAREWAEFDLGGLKTIDSLRLAFKSYIKPLDLRVYYGSDANDYKSAVIKNLPYSGDTYGFYASTAGDAQRLTLSGVRYVKVEMNDMSFDAQALRIISVEFGYTETNAAGNAENKKIDNKTVSVTASSFKSGHEASLMLDNDDNTYWENDNDTVYKTMDLGEVKAVGRVDLYWRGDDGGKGKYYDLQISNNGTDWTTVFRQNHGATPEQSIYVYDNARYLRVVDYQSGAADRFMLEGAVVHSQYPESSGEGKVKYDVSIKLPEYGTVSLGNGSYITGGMDFPSARLIAYIDDSLRGKPIPSNDWWQGLLIADKGYNMYMNPLTATFMSDGLWLTNPGSGYFSGIVPGNGSHTVNVDAHDLAIGYAGMGANAKVRVTGYSDYGVSAVMTDRSGVDKLTVFLNQGSLYAYCMFAEPEKALLLAKDFIGFYDIDGNEILAQTLSKYTGDCIVVKVLTHASYEGGIQKYKDGNAERENAKIYEERYYVVSVPANTTFVRGEDSVSVIMTEGNYMSVGAVAQKNAVREGERSGAAFPKAEAALLHLHGYAFVVDTSCLYDFDGNSNIVTTEFRVRTVLMRAGFSGEAYSAYMPHQLSKSDYKDGYVYPSIRGECRSFTGNYFVTKDTFYGIVPTFTEPTDDGYQSQVLYDQLLMLYQNNGGDKAPEDSNLISGDPYWQGKNLHPMAMAALAADQIGATDLRDKFLDKIEYILIDWFTYDEVKDAGTGAYFYYDSEWGTLYYKNSEFGAGVNLADHYFTYGYYTLASGVLAAFRPQFAKDWGDMIELLIRDYMNPSRDDELFPYMRNFDPFAGHGWAGGYADNNGGNNQESAGEALNSWVGAYLYATAIGDETIRTAAIYGYTTELNAIKHYWFNYYGDFSESYPYGVVGQVYGGSNFYGTFFNGQPLYMYGIHLIPGEEYLTSYALNDEERGMLEGLIDHMRADQAMWDVSDAEKDIHAWQHIFIPIVAIYDPDEAIAWYDQVLQKQGNVGNTSEQFNVYWLIHGMKTTGGRSTDIYAADGESATVYEKDGKYTALCWNPTGAEKKIIFKNKSGKQVGFAVVPASSLVSCDPTAETREFVSYTDIAGFKLDGITESTNVTVSGGKLVFGQNASCSYLLTFGSEEAYYNIKIAGASGVRLSIDGKDLPLKATAGGMISDPISLSFKHTVTVTASSAEVTGITFEKLTLTKQNVGMTATASSVNNPNSTADMAVDGDMSTRWETVHESDDEWLQIELAELTVIYQLRIYWEAASAKEYKVYLSQTGADDDWTEVYHGSYSQGERTDYVTPTSVMSAKYIRIQGISRITNYGYSIYELEVYNFNNN